MDKPLFPASLECLPAFNPLVCLEGSDRQLVWASPSAREAGVGFAPPEGLPRTWAVAALENAWGPLDARPLVASLVEAERIGSSRRVWHRVQAGRPQAWLLQVDAGPEAAPHDPAASRLWLQAIDLSALQADAEAQAQRADQQRDALIREVHHRLKNNLQGVAGLLDRLAQRHPGVSAPLAEAVSQLHAVAQVYGLQGQSTDPLTPYALVRSLAQQVEGRFGVAVGVDAPSAAESPAPPTAALRETLWAHLEPPVAGTSLSVAAPGWRLREEDATTLALALNELLTNAVKHATPGTPVRCRVESAADSVTWRIMNDGQLRDRSAEPSGAGTSVGHSGLGLVRALLPRRTAVLTLEQIGDQVQACLRVIPPVVQPETVTMHPLIQDGMR